MLLTGEMTTYFVFILCLMTHSENYLSMYTMNLGKGQNKDNKMSYICLGSRNVSVLLKHKD